MQSTTASFISYNRNHRSAVKYAIKQFYNMTYKNIITAIQEIQGWLLSNLMSKKWKRYREGGAADAVRLCLFVSNL